MDILVEIQRVGLWLTTNYDNDVTQLIVFILLLGTVFVIMHHQKNIRMANWRKSIRFSIGGWGSRGKSGTERLKAALFNASGLSLVSKTTGCEPVLIYSAADENLEELPLFRPFDKATIWEQGKVLQLASSKKVDLFLWECMGLEPEYVGILQRDWMQDDITTITNTYPDHEDIQGPSGWDVAHSISSITPYNSKVITAEDIMEPILRKKSEERNSKFIKLDSLFTHSLSNDVMKLFPYEEHPQNVSLVLRLADEMNIDREFALREMIKRVKPDIGVLKTYPMISWKRKQIEFSNGFSANEKVGCLSNWQRLGLEDLSKLPQEAVWISCLVNNREDRPARSRVFAEILVNSLIVDQFYLVGSAREGFKSIYENLVKAFVNSFDLSVVNSQSRLLEKLRVHLRIPLELEKLEHLSDELRAMKESTRTLWYQLVTEFIASGKQTEIKKFATKLLNDRLVIPPECMVAESLLLYLFERTPENTKNIIHGIQNIKGPGLLWLEMLEVWNTLQSVSTMDEIIANQTCLPLLLSSSERVSESAEFKNLLEEKITHFSSLNKTQTQRVNTKQLATWMASLGTMFRNVSKPYSVAFKVRKAERIYGRFSKDEISISEARRLIRELDA